jgi:hypothetical protein
MDPDKIIPQCFGDLETVFPLGEDGLRATPAICMDCPHKTACLRRAMGAKEGAAVKEELVDRAYKAGMLGFMQRWSKKKELHRRRKKESG